VKAPLAPTRTESERQWLWTVAAFRSSIVRARSAQSWPEKTRHALDAARYGCALRTHSSQHEEELRTFLFSFREGLAKSVVNGGYEALVLRLTVEHLLYFLRLLEELPRAKRDVENAILTGIRAAYRAAPSAIERLAISWTYFRLPRTTANQPQRAFRPDAREVSGALRELQLPTHAGIIERTVGAEPIRHGGRRKSGAEAISVSQSVSVVVAALDRALLPPQTAAAIRSLRHFLRSPEQTVFLFKRGTMVITTR
jgi:hypothetical protein